MVWWLGGESGVGGLVGKVEGSGRVGALVQLGVKEALP